MSQINLFHHYHIYGAALSDGNKVVFQIDLMHLFGQEDQRNSESHKMKLMIFNGKEIHMVFH